MNEPQPVSIESRLNVHLAEYNAVTMRATYLIATEALLFVALVTLFGASPGFIKFDSVLDFLTVIFVGQMAAILFSWLSYEERNMTLYIESVLKPKIQNLIDDTEALSYETYLFKNRPKATSYIQNIVLAIAPFLILSIVRTGLLIYANQKDSKWYYYDTIAVVINVMAFCILIYIIWLSFKIQRKMWKTL
jgi:hypothetical protein